MDRRKVNLALGGKPSSFAAEKSNLTSMSQFWSTSIADGLVQVAGVFFLTES